MASKRQVQEIRIEESLVYDGDVIRVNTGRCIPSDTKFLIGSRTETSTIKGYQPTYLMFDPKNGNLKAGKNLILLNSQGSNFQAGSSDIILDETDKVAVMGCDSLRIEKVKNSVILAVSGEPGDPTDLDVEPNTTLTQNLRVLEEVKVGLGEISTTRTVPFIDFQGDTVLETFEGDINTNGTFLAEDSLCVGDAIQATRASFTENISASTAWFRELKSITLDVNDKINTSELISSKISTGEVDSGKILTEILIAQFITRTKPVITVVSTDLDIDPENLRGLESQIVSAAPLTHDVHINLTKPDGSQYEDGDTIIIKDSTQSFNVTDTSFDVYIHAFGGDRIETRTELGLVQVVDGFYTLKTTGGSVTFTAIKRDEFLIWSIVAETTGNPRSSRGASSS